MSKWQTCAAADSFVKNKVGRQNQIPAKDIADVGRCPVIDQGQKFVAGSRSSAVSPISAFKKLTPTVWGKSQSVGCHPAKGRQGWNST